MTGRRWVGIDAVLQAADEALEAQGTAIPSKAFRPYVRMCDTCESRRGHMPGCPEGQETGSANPKKGPRATSGECGCSCGHLAGDAVNGVRRLRGGGCAGAKARDPHAAHCGRQGNGCGR